MDKIALQLASTKSQAEFFTKKAEILATYKGGDFEQDGYTVSFISPVKTRGEYLQCEIGVTKDGKPVKINNPIMFHNPPVMVGDGTFKDFELSNGVVTQVENVKEDPEQALRNILVNVIKFYDK